MDRKPETPREQHESDAQQPGSDEQPKTEQQPTSDDQPKLAQQPTCDDQPQVNGEGNPDETPPPKPKFIFDPRYCVDLTEKEAGRGFAFVGARDPRRRKKSD